jgi:hypothetical protein
MFADLVKHVDGFLSKYAVTGNDREKMKIDLLDLIQRAIEHGEAKDQNKVSGIVVRGIRALMGGKD